MSNCRFVHSSLYKPADGPILDTVFYTPSVVNAPRSIDADIKRCRDTLRDLVRRPLRFERGERLESIQRRNKEHRVTLLGKREAWDELSSEEATALLTGMDVSTVVGLRDRAIIAVMTFKSRSARLPRR